MIALRWSLALVLSGAASGQPFRQEAARESSETIRAAARAGPDEVWTWGERLVRWRLPSLKPETLGTFVTGEGGCVYDADGDGKPDLVAPVTGGLSLFRAPAWQREPIDEGPGFDDCLGLELFGRRGVVALARGMQLRFYQRSPRGQWSYRELYSFYTASHQGGLLARDIDGDGRTDLVCGNYWIQSPETFEQPWRLFAVNTWSETPEAAAARLAFRGMALVWAESRSSPARLAILGRPLNPKLLWEPLHLEVAPALAFPKGLAVFEDRFIVVGERNGPRSRLMVIGEDGRARTAERGWPVIAVLADDQGFWAIGERKVVRYAATGSQRPPPRR